MSMLYEYYGNLVSGASEHSKLCRRLISMTCHTFGVRNHWLQEPRGRVFVLALWCEHVFSMDGTIGWTDHKDNSWR